MQIDNNPTPLPAIEGTTESEAPGTAREAASPNPLLSSSELIQLRHEKAQKFTAEIINNLAMLSAKLKDETNPITFEQTRICILAMAFEAIASGESLILEPIIQAALHYARWDPTNPDPNSNFRQSRIIRAK